MALKTLHDAFVDELRDILSAEKQISSALPKMIRHSTSEELRSALTDHLAETKAQVTRLEETFRSIDLTPRAKLCEAAKGILKEGEGILEEEADPDVKDALIIAACQKVEHYEIATYGTLCTWARILGYTEALKLLKETINEEEKADKNLSKLAKAINLQAV